MRRWFLRVFWAVFLVLTLNAQDSQNEENPPLIVFPLTMILEGTEYAGEGVWRPDWPLELPPDAFKVIAGDVSRDISQITLLGEEFSLNCRFGSDRRVEEFPFVLNGRTAQISLLYNDDGELFELNVSFPPGEDTYKMEFLEYRDFFPAIVRGLYLDVWFFIYFSWGVNEINETWYDAEGSILGSYSFPLTEIGKRQRIREVKDFFTPENGRELFYDSRGFLTETSGNGGIYKVQYYREDLPRYWERRLIQKDEPEISAGIPAVTGNFSLQWDARGLLVRIAREADGGDYPVEYRYEYTMDELGNWIERREIRMTRYAGLLVPGRGTAFRRLIEYREP
ncbi:MAG: hypothetical protein LBH07_07560 [Treponema sp.]|jgi:hypothetical protein|nr:hypothetical protein [Treponema sp.]